MSKLATYYLNFWFWQSLCTRACDDVVRSALVFVWGGGVNTAF